MAIVKLTKRKECSVLTWQGWLLILVFSILLIAGSIEFVPSFLSVNKPIEAQVLVLDGQMPDYAIQKAISIFDSCNYQLIITTGGLIQSGYHLAGNKTMAEYSRAMFIDYGFDPNKVIAIPGGKVIRNRTYSSAMSLKNWLKNQNSNYNTFDIFAIGSHARRSRFLFRKALGDEYKVGSRVILNPAYDPHKWWRSSIGARAIISETIAFIYVRLFFSN